VPISTGGPTGPKKCESVCVPPDSGLLDTCHLAVSNAPAELVQAQTHCTAAFSAASQGVTCNVSTSLSAATITGVGLCAAPARSKIVRLMLDDIIARILQDAQARSLQQCSQLEQACPDHVCVHAPLHS
jgi:hypothetical protein